MEVALINKYRELLSERPKFGQGIENGLKIASQLVAMNWKLSEGLDTLSHLLAMFNDKIYLDAVFGDEKFQQFPLKERLQRMITYAISVLDYSEVFLELMARSYLKNKAQWAIISIIVLLKTSMRLTMLVQKRVMQRLYPMTFNPLVRHQLLDSVSFKQKFAHVYVSEQEMFCILKRSGRKLRKLQHTPPRSERSWNVDATQELSSQVKKKSLLYPSANRLEAIHLCAEIMFVLKQALSLGLVYFLGSGKLSFILQLCIDVAALAPFILTDRVWTDDERSEINRRIHRMLIYLIKAPFEILFVLLKLLESSPLLGCQTSSNNCALYY